MDQATLEMRRIQLNSYIEEIILSLKPKLKRTKHTIEVDCDPDLYVVTTPGLLSQILTNLITNSLKHGFETIESGLIQIAITKDSSSIHIKYSDNGVGIPPEHHIDHIFEPISLPKGMKGGVRD